MKVVMIMDLAKLKNEYHMDLEYLLEIIIKSPMPIVILFKDRQSRILYVNDQFYQKHPEFKKNPDSVLGKTDFDLFPSSLEHASQAFEDEQNVMETGQAINIFEVEGLNQQGFFKIAHTRKYPVYNNNRECVGIFVVTEDVSNDLSVLQESQEKNAQLMKLNKELTQENTKDSLSGLFNRRFIRAQLNSLYQQYLEEKTPFSILLIDLDNFKQINDTYGHTLGDEVIHYVGEILLNIKRQYYPTIDPCRYGGNEFLVIIPIYQKEGALKIAKDILEAFENQKLHSGDFHQNIQMSIGIATIDNESIHHLLERCDQCLYQAKKDGKHKIYG